MLINQYAVLILISMLVPIVDINACLFQGTDVLEKVGGLHNFMNWKRAMLTVG
jgi:hypothetical protein